MICHSWEGITAAWRIVTAPHRCVYQLRDDCSDIEISSDPYARPISMGLVYLISSYLACRQKSIEVIAEDT